MSEIFRDTRWGIRGKNTKENFPMLFVSRKEAEIFRLNRTNPDDWEIVKQTVTYSDWELG